MDFGCEVEVLIRLYFVVVFLNDDTFHLVVYFVEVKFL